MITQQDPDSGNYRLSPGRLANPLAEQAVEEEVPRSVLVELARANVPVPRHRSGRDSHDDRIARPLRQKNFHGWKTDNQDAIHQWVLRENTSMPGWPQLRVPATAKPGQLPDRRHATPIQRKAG